MSPFLLQALASLDSDDTDVVNDAILIIAEVAAVNRKQGFRSEIIPEANDEILPSGGLEIVERRLMAWVAQNPQHPSAGSVFFALDKCGDEALREFFVTQLDSYTSQVAPSMHCIGQILVALNNMGENAISGNAFSSTDLGKNLDDAVAYLRNKRPGNK